MFIKTRKFLCYFLISLLTSLSTISALQAQDLADGKKTFDNVCSSCHKLGEVLIGPNLVGVKSRWKDEKKLLAFVHNSQEVIKSGDPYAKALFGKFNVIMPPQDLTDAQVQNVLAYVDAGGMGAVQNANGGGGGATVGSGGGATMSPVSTGDTFLGLPYEVTLVVLLLVALILIGVAILLYRVRRHLAQMNWEKEHPGGEPVHEHKPGWFGRVWHSFRATANPVIVVLLVLMVLTLLSVVSLYHRAQDLGTQVGYAPEQPIRFNHKIHAGQYGINCQYCHNGVTSSKNATIPPVSTCMNCHNYIKEGPQYGKTEIAKLVNYYQKQEPIRWVRIHNLPAHVYFNHAQHVNAGQLDCANCHGQVAQMVRVQQMATLEMGWCINCHREKAVNSANPYYSTYDFVKKHKKYTIAQLGGLECSKCHY